jgi:hypothetical protein
VQLLREWLDIAELLFVPRVEQIARPRWRMKIVLLIIVILVLAGAGLGAIIKLILSYSLLN